MDSVKNDYIKEFNKIFEEMTYKRGLNRRSAWENLMLMFAIDISNFTEIREEVKKDRLDTFSSCTENLGGTDEPQKLFNIIVKAISENPEQDFLGDLYMSLGGIRELGQCFTPYHICSLMAELSLEDSKTPIEENGFVSVADPCVGAGAMLIASANKIRNDGYDPSTQALFYGQDLDQTCVCMAYIQLSLQGLPAVVVQGNSLTEPYTGNPMFVEDNSNYWYTPILYTKAWEDKRKEYIKKYKKDVA